MQESWHVSIVNNVNTAIAFPVACAARDMHPVPRVASAPVKIAAVYVTTTVMMPGLDNSGSHVWATVDDGSKKRIWRTEEINSLFVTSAYNIEYMLT
jgi:hypothetical protein